ncbi:MAG: DUF6079 family protein [Desulfitobacterium hafniense]|nr:DUF6079 family protein [Desulfitobacterium hafniense]
MKYGELVKFDPIETVIQIRDAEDKTKAAKLIESYVMSDDMADMIDAKMLSQLSLYEVIDNKGIFLVGNYGTGKSHLMSVISSIAQDEINIQYVKNAKFAQCTESIAGRFEVLRIEIGAVKTSLRDIVTDELEKDLAKRGISFTFPDSGKVTSNKDAFNDLMSVFQSKYGAKGYLLVIDELLDYLKSRNQYDLMLDLGFLRELGEFIKNSRFRLICGIQEALFDNPAFTFVATTLLKVKDRFEQAIIRREDISYVVSERILSKTPEQKAKIREHLTKFCPLYKNMSERLEEYVELFPIHPAYIETFQKVYLAEKREVLKTISATVKKIINDDVPMNESGIKSYDTYWVYIKENLAKKAEPEIKEVLEKSGVLEDIVNRSFTAKAIYKPLAIQIIYALSVHRLTTMGLDVRAGLTVNNLKDDLCLYIETPVKDEEFLLSTISNVMKSIMDTVSGQFIEYNKDNEQYYLDLKKDVDYESKIEQKANSLHDSQLNQYFYNALLETLEWDKDQYVPGYFIYEYPSLIWEEKNINRNGYLFLGIPNDRPTAQPPQDFYVYFTPPYGNIKYDDDKKEDEVFLKLKDDETFKASLKMYAGAKEMEGLAAQNDTKKAYRDRAENFKKEVKKWLNTNRISAFSVVYKGTAKSIIEILHGRKIADRNFKEIVDLVASLALSDYFNGKYPKYPKFQVKVTEKNMREVLGRGLDYIAGKITQDGAALLDSFGLLQNGKIKPENSPYAMHFIKKVKDLQAGGVINASDIIANPYPDIYFDKEFLLGREWLVLLFASMIYNGHITLLAGNGERYDASNLEKLAKENVLNLYEFKHIAKPKAAAINELKRLFVMLGIPEGLIINPNTWDEATIKLLEKSRSYSDKAIHAKNILNENFVLWGDLIIPMNKMQEYKTQLQKVVDFGNAVNSRFNTAAKLQNFDYSDQMLTELEEAIILISTIERFEEFKNKCSANVEYFSKVELVLEEGALKDKIKAQKDEYLKIRDELADSDESIDYGTVLNNNLTSLKSEYISFYMEQHARCRLSFSDGNRKGEIQQGATMANARKLTGIKEILPPGKLSEIEKNLSALKICFELTPQELSVSHICPHCHFKLSDNEKNVKGRLDTVEESLENLCDDWTKILLSAISDPFVLNDLRLLKPAQKELVDKLIATKRLPENVDAHFVETINLLLSGLEKVVVDADYLVDEISKLGPCTVDDFKQKIDSIISGLTSGKDKNKLRVILNKKADEKNNSIGV